MFLRYFLTTLAFVTYINGSVLFSLQPHELHENQYKRRKGNEEPGQPTTVDVPRSNGGDPTFGALIPPRPDELQGSPKSVPHPEQHVEHSPHEPVDKSTGNAEQNRNKRSYYVYPVPKFQNIGAWRSSSSVYPVPRQYFLPIYGVDGKKTIYLPQQQFYVHGKNPIKTNFATPSTILIIPAAAAAQNTRFGYDSEDEVRPMWDNEPVSRPKRTQNLATSTKKPEIRTIPPFVHKENYNSTGSINHLSANGGDRRYPDVKSTKPQVQGPSKCVWAIVSCCSTSSNEVNYSCFNQMGCAGPFLDGSPCEAAVVKKAIESASNFYGSRNKKDKDRPTVINIGKR